MLLLSFPLFGHYGVICSSFVPRQSVERRIYDTMVAICLSGESHRHQLIELASGKQQADSSSSFVSTEMIMESI
jgi:hypothetical protein